MINKNDGFYKEKYFVAKNKDIDNLLNELKYNGYDTAFRAVLDFFNNLEKRNNNEYLVVNQDEPYAEEIYNIIKDHNKKQIVAFIGRAGSGKDYQSQLLMDKGFNKIAFADALRDITAQIVRYPLSDLIAIYDDFKSGDIFPDYTGRELMENIGAAIRKYEPDFWVNAAQLQITQNGLKKVVISDMRYINEYFKMQQFCNQHDFEFKCIFCDYHSNRYQENNKHQSAWLSNFFATHGYQDLDEIKEDDIQYALKHVPDDDEELIN